jgi:uncharacterized membrane protein YbhN (UPF0104 family)
VHAALPFLAPPCAAAGAVVLLVARLLGRRGPARLRRLVQVTAVEMRALLRRTTWPTVLLTSLLVVAGYLGTFLLAAHAAGVPGVPLRLLPLAFVVLLAASIPVNVAGWGPREGVAVWIFAAGGWGADTGAAVATAFGVMTVVSTLPGAIVLLAGRRRRRARTGSEGREAEGREPTRAALVGARPYGAADD